MLSRVSHTACAANHQKRLASTAAFNQAEAVEQHFPCSDGRQRQARAFNEIKRCGFLADDTLVNGMELSVCPVARHVTCVEHLVTDRIAGYLRPDFNDRASGVETQNADIRLRRTSRAQFDVNWIDGDTFDSNQQIARAWRWSANIEQAQCACARNGSVLGVAECLHVQCS